MLWYVRWACMKTLQGNLDFFLIRASRGPFRLKHKTQGPFHIHIPKGKLLLRCLWKDGLHLHSKTGNQLSSTDDIVSDSRERPQHLQWACLSSRVWLSEGESQWTAGHHVFWPHAWRVSVSMHVKIWAPIHWYLPMKSILEWNRRLKN